MELTDLTMKVLFLFLPGIISYILIASLTETKYTSFQFIVRAFVLGCLSYLLLFFIYFLINSIWNITPKLEVVFLKNITNNQNNINVTEILYVSVCSIIIALILVKIINKAYLHRLAMLMRISNKSGHRDVWDKLFSKDEVEWLVIRDKNKKLMYEGKVEQYSTEHTDGEIYMTDVKVYNDDTGELNYETKGLYISYIKESMIIEIYQFTERGNKHERATKSNSTKGKAT